MTAIHLTVVLLCPTCHRPLEIGSRQDVEDAQRHVELHTIDGDAPHPDRG